ncbi:hypothetical protein ABGB18_28680 [Nonomuraea sp. B12E4]|uniref:hypothetical protein n=1 Tax=Nonomuraea sp. B12E4 TaxID=3153564 RepID=UPI00325E4268
MATQVHGEDPMGAGQQRGDRVPVQEGAAQAVEQQHGSLAAAVVADGQGDGTVVDDHVV